MRVLALGLLTVLSGLALGSRAHAHPAPSSLVTIDLTVEGARLEQDVPLAELELALHRELLGHGEDAAHAVQRQRSLLLDYARAHVRASGAQGGAPWQVLVRDVRGHVANDGPRATFDILLRAPSRDTASSLVLEDDVVTHEVMSHYTAVYLRSDWSEGTGFTPRMVATLRAGRSVVTVTRAGSLWQGFRRVVVLGAEHISSGTDHLLFLFSLVLVAPLIAEQSRWRPRASTRGTLGQLLRVVSAFTLGHSLTLAMGAVDGVLLPADLVEIGIALSVLLAACNALTPIFAGREAILALVFGLVHGLAFASTIANSCLGTAQTLWTLLGFNLGIELAQLALLCLVVPWLLLLARTPAYRLFRILGGTLTALFALGWLLERTGLWANPLTPFVDWLNAHPTSLLAALAGGTIVARIFEHGGRTALREPDPRR